MRLGYFIGQACSSPAKNGTGSLNGVHQFHFFFDLASWSHEAHLQQKTQHLFPSFSISSYLHISSFRSRCLQEQNLSSGFSFFGFCLRNVATNMAKFSVRTSYQYIRVICKSSMRTQDPCEPYMSPFERVQDGKQHTKSRQNHQHTKTPEDSQDTLRKSPPSS